MKRDLDLTRYLLLIAGLVALPVSGTNSLVNLADFVAIQPLPAIGLSLLMGYTGQISLGHAAFYGLGAYGSVLLTTHLGIDPWLGLLLSAVLVGALGWSLGLLVFCLEGHFLAMATLGFGVIVHVWLVEFCELAVGTNWFTRLTPFNLF